MGQTPPPSHFAGKEAIKHVTENLAKGIIASAEIHGTEIPGAISSFSDAAKESAIASLLIWIALTASKAEHSFLILTAFAAGYIIWKSGRSAFLGYARLERLNRIAMQEKWEIEHNREQEREELTELYRAKGFEGKLLTDVIDVLMSDGDILLRVMLEEELGLSLEVHEHPLKQAFGAFLGSSLSFLLCAVSSLVFPSFGPLIAGLIIVALSSFISAKYEKNDLIPASVWNLALFLTASGTAYFLMQYLIPKA